MSKQKQKTAVKDAKQQEIKENIQSLKTYVTSRIRDLDFSDVNQRQIVRSAMTLNETF